MARNHGGWSRSIRTTRKRDIASGPGGAETLRLGHGQAAAARPGWARHLAGVAVACAALGILPGVLAGATPAQARRHVLVLNSYHEGYVWTDGVVAGVKAALGAAGGNVELHIEYMDTKRHWGEGYLESLRAVYGEKYRTQRPDLVIASDDAAFTFLAAHHDDLFPGVPVVFCGLNAFDDTMLEGRPLFTGVVEVFDAEGTLDAALRIHPETRRVLIINDMTVTGQGCGRVVRGIPGKYAGRVEFEWMEDATLEEVLDRVGDLPSDALVLYIGLFRDRSGRYFPYAETLSRISKSSSVPLYGLWAQALGHGIVGGKLNSGYFQGEKAGQMAAEILGGKPVSALPVWRTGVNPFMFDHAEMARWGIPRSALPAESLVVNEPTTFYARHKALIAGTATFIVVETLIIAALLVNYVRRRRAEEAYRMVVERSLQGLVVLKDDRVLSANPALVQMGGYTQGELRSLPAEEVRRLVHPEDRERIWGFLADWRAGKPVSPRQQFRLLHKNGSVLWVEGLVSPITYRGGPATQVAFLDITDRKQAEEAIRAAEARYRQLVNHMSSGVAVYAARDDGKDFVFTEFNQAAERIDGVRREAVVGRSVLEAFPGVRDLGLLEVFQRVWKTGRPEHVPPRLYQDARGAGWRENYVYRLPSGEVVAIYDDVTERLRGEEALRESEERFRSTFEQAAVGIAHAGTDGRFLRINQRYCDIVGYTREEMLARTFQDITHPDDLEANLRFVRQLLAGQAGTYSMEKRYLHKSGAVVWVNVTVSLLRDGAGKPQYFIGVVEDITQRKALEQQLRQVQRMEAVGRLAGGVAHDFNNQLTVIKGYCDVLLRQLPPESPAREPLGQILASARQAADLTRQLLAFGRKQLLQPQVIDVNEVLRQTADPIRRLIGDDVELVLRLGDGLKAVNADPVGVRQVLLNLATNARDAMPDGGRLTVETADAHLDDGPSQPHPGAASGPHVILAVSDTGVGMDEETRRRLFDPFFTTKPVGMGSGLGLASVYGFVKQSGGYIHVASERGKGTTVCIHLPRVEDSAVAPEPQAAPSAGGTGTETILLVEDEPTVRAFVARVLRDSGYTVLEADGAERALRLHRDHPEAPDLVITDVVMPEMNGPELVRHVHTTHPGTPVLYITGYAEDSLIARGALDAGANLLQKPFTPAALLEAVRRTLETGGHAASQGAGAGGPGV